MIGFLVEKPIITFEDLIYEKSFNIGDTVNGREFFIDKFMQQLPVGKVNHRQDVKTAEYGLEKIDVKVVEQLFANMIDFGRICLDSDQHICAKPQLERVGQGPY